MNKVGAFLPRYRCFYVALPPDNGGPIRMRAECLGAVFKVYAPARCPALPRSTTLTKVCISRSLAAYDVDVTWCSICHCVAFLCKYERATKRRE